MSNLGLGALIHMLGGNKESAKAFNACRGKTITELFMKDDVLHFRFQDGTGLTIRDNGQSCCEHRYMMTDDKLDDFIGAELLNAELKPAPEIPHDGGVHEVRFLDVTTSKGVFQMATHNVHNGYYGGFWIECALL